MLLLLSTSSFISNKKKILVTINVLMCSKIKINIWHTYTNDTKNIKDQKDRNRLRIKGPKTFQSK